MIEQWRKDPGKFENKKWKYYPDKFVTVNGIRTRYWDVGRGKKTIVLIHGFTGSVEEWAWNIIPLAKKYRVVAFDLPGHGRSDKPDISYHYDFFVSYTAGLFRALGIRSAFLMGHSLGANVSIVFSLTHPKIVEKLVLIAPPFDKKKPSLTHKMLVMPFLGEYFMRPLPSRNALLKSFRGLTYDPCGYADVTLDRYFEFQHSPGYIRAALRFMRHYIHPFGYKSATWKKLGEIEEQAPGFRKPVFVVWGRQDAVVPFRASEYVFRLLPHAEFWPIDHCGHAPLWEYPDEFNKRVDAFLSMKPSSNRKGT